MSPLQTAKLVLTEATGLAKDALHVYVGLGVMLLVAILLRRSLSDPRPILAAAFVAIAGEIWDVVDTLSLGGRHRWGGSIKDIWNTLFWPSVIFLLSRFTDVLKR